MNKLSFTLKIKLTTILLVLLISSCSTQTVEPAYTNCLNGDQTEYKKMIISFENSLAEMYKVDKKSINGKHYREFVKDISEMKISNTFFRENERVDYAKNLKNLSIHKNIWEKKSVLKEENESFEEILIAPPPDYDGNSKNVKPERPDVWLINCKTKFYSCLIDNTTNTESKSLLIDYGKIPEISPSITAKYLLTIDNFEEESTIKQFIMISFYYELIYFLNEISTED